MKKIPVGVYLDISDYLKKYQHNTLMCSQMLMSHKFFDDNYMCSIEIMTTIYFAELHNLSLNMIVESVKFSDTSQFISSSAYQINSHKRFSFERTGLGVSDHQSQKIIYCSKTKLSNKSQFDYSVWIEPFPNSVWVLFIVSFLFVPFILFKKGVGNKLEGIFALLSSQSISLNNGKILVALLSFGAMIVSNFYTNEITSLMVVPTVLKPFQSLKEMLDAGYKIMVNFNFDLPTMIKAYEDDFRFRNLSDRLNSSFHRRKENYITDAEYLENNKTNYALIAQEDVELYFNLKFTITFKEKFGVGAVKCQSVSESIRPVYIFRVFYTVIRYCLLQTLKRIKNAGLDTRWRQWFYWQCIFAEKSITRGVKIGGLGLIEMTKMTKITPVFVLWALVGLVAVVVFVFEAYQNF